MSNLLLVNIPSYKQEELLKRALNSLSDQTYKNFEIVILDDQSKVDYSNIFKDFQDLSVTVETNQKNLGAMENIKQSIFKSKHRYTLSLHEDDYLAENYIENAINILEDDNSIAFVSSAPAWISQSEQYKKAKQENNNSQILNTQNFVRAIISNQPIMFGSVVYRSNCLHEKMWNYEKYNTFCDRVFLCEILNQSNKNACHMTSPGIYVRDHSQDKQDLRSQHQKIKHFINLIKYYNLLLSEGRTVSDLYLIIKTTLIGFLYYTNIIKIIRLITRKI